MLSTNPAELLRSDNPKDRAQGIKLVARMQDERALRILAQVADGDDDPRVREYAQKGARYVATKMEERGQDPGAVLAQLAPAADAPPPAPEPAPFQPVEVDEKTEQRAQDYVNEAMDHNFSGDREKALKALTKALKTNPNLQIDEYFLSVASDVTGMDGNEALMAVMSKDQRQQLVQQDEQREQEQSIQEHMDTAEGFTWVSVSLDIAILSAIAFFGMFFTVLAINYTANTFVNNVVADIEAQIEEAGGRGELNEESLEQIARNEVQVESVREILGVFGPALGSVMGLTVLLGLLTTVFVLGFVGHAIAQAFGGKGTVPYLIHNLIGAYQVPMLALFGWMIIALFLLFVGRFISIWFGGIVVLVTVIITLVMGFRASNRFKQAYRLNLLQAQAAYFIAGIPAALAVAGVVFVLYLVFTPFYAGLAESVGNSLANVDLPG